MSADLPSRRRLLAATAASLLPAAWPGAHAASVKTGQIAPDFTLPREGGGNLKLSEQRGQVVLVNFWATWCGPCLIELPHLNRLHDRWRGAGVLLLGIAVDNDPRAAAAMARRLDLRFPTLFDSAKTVSRTWDLDAMPSTVLLDRDGRVRHVHLGYREGLEKTYEAQLRELVKE
jgi:peroxiredoxin